MQITQLRETQQYTINSRSRCAIDTRIRTLNTRLNFINVKHGPFRGHRVIADQNCATPAPSTDVTKMGVHDIGDGHQMS